MSNRRDSFDLSTNDPNKVIEVCVRYHKTDNSYHNPNAEQQGYWLNITPVKIEGSFRVTTCFTGLKKFLEPAKRFSEGKLEKIMGSVYHEIMTGHVEDANVKMALRVAEENGLSITHWANAIKEREARI